MKRSNKKKQLMQSIKLFYRPVLIGALFLCLTITLFYKRPVQAASTRAKKAAAILVGAGGGGTIAGVAGSAKWVPLGLFGGGLAGGLIYRGIRKNRKQRAKQSQGRAGRHRKNQWRRSENQQGYQPVGSYEKSTLYMNSKY